MLPTLLLPLGALRPPAPMAQRVEFWGFTGPWDPLSALSARRHADKLAVVVTGWIAFDSISGRPIIPSLFPDTILPRKGTVRRMAIVTTWQGDRFHPSSVRQLSADPMRLGQAAGAIARHLSVLHYRGLVLDLEGLQPADLEGQLRVVKAITDSAHARRIRPVVVAIPAVDSASFPTRPLLAVSDLLLVMLYDQHWVGGVAGAVAEPTWVRAALAARVAQGSSTRLVAALPTYGYRWRKGAPTESVSYADAIRIAASSGVSLERDQATSSLRATRPGEWEMWVSDAPLIAKLVEEVKGTGVRHIALWRLGGEDPAIWRGGILR
ncbi:MAG: hypothetical protein NVS4B3_00250 [Gemmatimonadaceae bacterium]